MPILIVILIVWFNWLVYSAHHRLQPLSAKMCLNRYLVCATFFVRKLEL